MSIPYKLRIVQQGFEFEAEGDKEFVLEMADRFEVDSRKTLSQVTPGDLDADEAATTKPTKTESVREFLTRLGLKRHVDMLVGFGYYLEHRLGKAEFTPADINNCYYEAKMEPTNTSQSIINATKRGLIMEAKTNATSTKKGAKKKYTLTHSGEEFINKKLSS